MTDKTVAKAARDAKEAGTDIWMTDAAKQRGIGRLRLRASANGQTSFYFRYSTASSKQDQIALGIYDRSGAAGLTLGSARARAGELSKLYQSGRHDLRDHLANEAAADRARTAAAARARIEAERQAVAGTLQTLMDGYVAHLTRQGKLAAQDVKNLFRHNVEEAFPHLAAMRAADITHRDIAAILAKMIERKVGRTASKLRSYLRAAFGEALSAEGEPTAHPALLGFALTSNPAALVPARKLAAYNLVRERVLTEAEMHHFLGRLDKQSGVAHDAILLALYLGGQRSAQLLRLKRTDVDLVASEVTLFDGKGSRQQPRKHVLPLTERAAEVVSRLIALNGEKPYLIVTTSQGKKPPRSDTLATVVREISAAMVAEGISREPFQMRDLRRTSETMLARMGVSKDVRAHILSHGLGGVQDRVYNRHDYADEKRSALEAWDARLAEIASGVKQTNVVPMRAKAKK